MPVRQSNRIAARQQAERQLSDPVPPLPAKKKRQTASEAVKACRERMKVNNPEKYKRWREKGKDDSKLYRLNLTEGKKAHQRERARLRMQAHRERKKSEQTEKPRKTRAAIDDQRAKWREQKHHQEDKLTPQQKAQKKRRNNEKRRSRYKEKKLVALLTRTSNASKSTQSAALMEVREQCTEGQEEEVMQISGVRSPAARRKALSRVKAMMPCSPRKYVQTVSDLMTKASPRKKSLFNSMKKQCVEQKIGREVLRRLKSISRQRSKNVNYIRNVLLSVFCKYKHSLRTSSSLLGVHRKTVAKCVGLGESFSSSRVILKKCKKAEAEATAFLEFSASALPEKKLVSKKTGRGAAVLTRPMKDLYDDFKESEAMTTPISFSHFAKCRPTHIRLMRQSQLRQCLCEYCTNAELKIRAVNGIAARMNNACRIRHVYHAVDIITCGREDRQWKKDCAYRECGTCSIDQLDHHLEPLLQHQGPVTWTKWESQVSIVNGKRVR